MALGQNLVALVNIKIARNWVFTPLTLIVIGFDAHTHIVARLRTLQLNPASHQSDSAGFWVSPVPASQWHQKPHQPNGT